MVLTSCRHTLESILAATAGAIRTLGIDKVLDGNACCSLPVSSNRSRLEETAAILTASSVGEPTSWSYESRIFCRFQCTFAIRLG